MANGSLSSEAGWTDECDCYCGGWSLRGGSLEQSVCAVPTLRVDSIAERLIGFPRDQLVQTRSGSLLFGAMWMVLLSWHAAKLGPR